MGSRTLHHASRLQPGPRPRCAQSGRVGAARDLLELALLLVELGHALPLGVVHASNVPLRWSAGPVPRRSGAPAGARRRFPLFVRDTEAIEGGGDLGDHGIDLGVGAHARALGRPLGDPVGQAIQRCDGTEEVR